jgi:hypothetical protein
MGYGANFAEVITPAALKRLCPKTFKIFRETLEDAQMDEETLAQHALDYDIEIDPDILYHKELIQAVHKAYKALQKDFNRRVIGSLPGSAQTKESSRLSLVLNFHDSNENGDKYDEVNGPFWEVLGMYQLSPAGKKIARSVRRRFWVTCE